MNKARVPRQWPHRLAATHAKKKRLEVRGPLLLPALLLLVACLSLNACKVRRTVQGSEAGPTQIGGPAQPPDAETRYVNVHYNRHGGHIRLASKKNGGLLNKKLDAYQYYIGILGAQLTPELWGVLELASGNVRLTSTGVVEGRAPQPLLVQSKHKGKLAVVSGFLNGASIYDAKIEAVFETEPLPLLLQLMEQQGLVVDDYAE